MLDSILRRALQAVFTAMPLRFLGACLTLARGWHWRLSQRLRPPTSTTSALAAAPAAAASLSRQSSAQRRKQRQRGQQTQRGGSAFDTSQPSTDPQTQAAGQAAAHVQPSPPAGPAAAPTITAVAAAAGGTRSAAAFDEWSRSVEAAADEAGRRQRFRLRGDQLFDVICVFIFLMAVRVLQLLSRPALDGSWQPRSCAAHCCSESSFNNHRPDRLETALLHDGCCLTFTYRADAHNQALNDRSLPVCRHAGGSAAGACRRCCVLLGSGCRVSGSDTV